MLIHALKSASVPAIPTATESETTAPTTDTAQPLVSLRLSPVAPFAMASASVVGAAVGAGVGGQMHDVSSGRS